MKAKYFSADSLEAAEAKAEAWFSCKKDELEIEIIKGSEEDPNWQILALDGMPGELANADARYNLYYESDGVYLEIYRISLFLYGAHEVQIRLFTLTMRFYQIALFKIKTERHVSFR